ncbi:hypothetical protein RJ639_006475 [Escallonia herrerae]|uniref:Phenazine biosynthesis PhzC/PhzF protein n=1 Tax=Escallonia herrerae TaxID=1293975 RepID=A0AA88VVE6_9ASTE|nr:hypothetical protein RJ639_006475 [Escallonia herrerae]
MAKKPVKYSVVDAFTDTAYKGNPAAVCLLEEERDEEWLLAVAAEFNISETCYLTRITGPESVPHDSPTPRFRLRWFTPVAEVKLCGHATLAAAHFLFTSGLVNTDLIEFLTLSGILTAKRVADSKIADDACFENGEVQDGFFVELDFPTVPLHEYNSADVSAISDSLSGASAVDMVKTSYDDILVVLPTGKAVVELEPQFDKIQQCPGKGIIVTGVAPSGSGFDFYSRFFCPKFGIKEDPVCGSAHCALALYWHKKLGKCDFVAYAASPRGGVVHVHVDEKNERVLLRGKAIAIMEGSILA